MLAGFGNYFQSEARKGALPLDQNNPQKCPEGLFAELLSGNSFTSPRKDNLRTWFYKIQPSAVHGPFVPFELPNWKTGPFPHVEPNQLRWKPFPYASEPQDFLTSMTTYCGNGSPDALGGIAVHLYAATQSMTQYFYNADGDLLIVPQEGKLKAKTECGELEVSPSEILIIPRGIKFQIELLDRKARGYVAENYGAHFVLPELGPIGSNGLANPRHFLAPVAAYEDKRGGFELIAKLGGKFYRSALRRSPLDVVAWHGTYYPYKYDLKLFNTMNTVSFDHPDPSIFTVLSSPSNTPGVSNLDFVIFPPRWMVAEHTFRPPYYHRNIMSEFMGLIEGVYDAKSDEFSPGGASLHNCMSAHGPDAQTFEKASNAELKPERYKNTLAFMFETRLPFGVTDLALSSPARDLKYQDCWNTGSLLK